MTDRIIEDKKEDKIKDIKVMREKIFEEEEEIIEEEEVGVKIEEGEVGVKIEEGEIGGTEEEQGLKTMDNNIDKN